MIHIEIFFCIFTLMLGTWAVYYTFQMSRIMPHSFLKPISFFILFYNLSILMRLITQYTCANILASCFIFNASIYSKTLAPFAFLINIGMTTAIGTVVLTFMGKKLSQKVKWLIVFFIILVVLAYSTKIIFSHMLNLLPWMPLFNQRLYLAVVIIAFLFLVFLFIHSFRESDLMKVKMIRSFSIFYLVAYLCLILSFLFHPILQYFYVIIVHILFNVFIIFWIRKFFVPFHRQMISTLTNNNLITEFSEKYDISKRESEIAELILAGKSNKEIEHQLFISPHTVKNHIYNIYQKMGVNSRGQLINFILKTQKLN